MSVRVTTSSATSSGGEAHLDDSAHDTLDDFATEAEGAAFVKLTVANPTGVGTYDVLVGTAQVVSVAQL